MILPCLLDLVGVVVVVGVRGAVVAGAAAGGEVARLSQLVRRRALQIRALRDLGLLLLNRAHLDDLRRGAVAQVGSHFVVLDGFRVVDRDAVTLKNKHKKPTSVSNMAPRFSIAFALPSSASRL